MDQHLISHAARNVPRYTSYPTAPHFTVPVDGPTYASWLEALSADATLSLYLHVPFCRSICNYCGCHTKAVRRPEPVAAYASTLRDEIALAGDRLDKLGPDRNRPLVHLHWGGGTPSLVDPTDFADIVALIGSRFDIRPDAEHAIELDPRMVTPGRIAMLAAAGINRASLGVQDLNRPIQQAIGRIQDESIVDRVVRDLRSAGIGAINMDLMYGLPHQGTREILRTVDLSVAMTPQRISLFGYAHVPWMKAHQRLIDTSALPGTSERIEQSEAAAEHLVRNGYVRIGIDHFALPDDPLAIAARQGRLRRNFQGYTVDPADALIGLGASSIGRLPQGYVQNAADVAGWRRRIETGELPVVRGKTLDTQDRARAEIIERLMCDFRVDAEAIFAKYDLPAQGLAPSYKALEPLVLDGIAVRDGPSVAVPHSMRSMVRLVAAAFDAYLPTGGGRHTAAV